MGTCAFPLDALAMLDGADRTITVAGGVYRERCLRPQWREVFGSAGRAAAALRRMGADVTLETLIDPSTSSSIRARAAAEGFSLRPSVVEVVPSFQYVHGLDTPRIDNRQAQTGPITVSADRVLRFGMLDAEAVVQAHRAVYDPQDAFAPQPFQANGSHANELALVLNRTEAARMTGLVGSSPREIAAALYVPDEVRTVVIKLGALGALVCDESGMVEIPAFQTNKVWKIGSGDNFAAHFAFQWLLNERSAVDSAVLASRATAYFCQTKNFCSPQTLRSFEPEVFLPGDSFLQGVKPKVYLAGPFFTLAQVWLIDQARLALSSMGLDVFSPFHDVGYGNAEDVVDQDLAGLIDAHLVFAVTDGLDAGTLFEVGYARARDIPVIAYGENVKAEDHKMLEGSDCVICEDFVTAVYRAFWIAASR